MSNNENDIHGGHHEPKEEFNHDDTIMGTSAILSVTSVTLDDSTDIMPDISVSGETGNLSALNLSLTDHHHHHQRNLSHDSDHQVHDESQHAHSTSMLSSSSSSSDSTTTAASSTNTSFMSDYAVSSNGREALDSGMIISSLHNRSFSMTSEHDEEQDSNGGGALGSSGLLGDVDDIYQQRRRSDSGNESENEEMEDNDDDDDEAIEDEEDEFVLIDDEDYFDDDIIVERKEQFNVGIDGDSHLYDELLRQQLLPQQFERSGIFRFDSSPPSNDTRNHSSASMLHRTGPLLARSQQQPPRRIDDRPYKVLDAPGITSDYYLNLVDWSANNVIAVALEDMVYLWNASSSTVSGLCRCGSVITGVQGTSLGNGTARSHNNGRNGGNNSNNNHSNTHRDFVTSVSWVNTGTMLAVGDNSGLVHLWDVTTMTRVRTLRGHEQRVASLSWNGTATLSSGGRDRHIIHHDVRSDNSHIARLLSHTQEVCGLKWSPDGKELASGGNDNLLNVWQPTYSNAAPVIQFTQHTAAVKALAWSPHQHGLLASGGGTLDKCIRTWSTVSQSLLHTVDTGAQVCNMAWSENVNELVSTHGYSHNQIHIWKYPSMRPVASLTGHTDRVFYLAVSPDGRNIVTGSGDETIRLWNVFPERRNHYGVYYGSGSGGAPSTSSSSSPMSIGIR